MEVYLKSMESIHKLKETFLVSLTQKTEPAQFVVSMHACMRVCVTEETQVKTRAY